MMRDAYSMPQERSTITTDTTVSYCIAWWIHDVVGIQPVTLALTSPIFALAHSYALCFSPGGGIFLRDGGGNSAGYAVAPCS